MCPKLFCLRDIGFLYKTVFPLNFEKFSPIFTKLGRFICIKSNGLIRTLYGSNELFQCYPREYWRHYLIDVYGKNIVRH